MSMPICPECEYDLPHGCTCFRADWSESPLSVYVADGRLVISIGVETLKYCHNSLEEGFEAKKGYGSGFLITDAKGFAADVASELTSEREDGSTILTDLLDVAVQKAADNGSLHAKERFAWYCKWCSRGRNESDPAFARKGGDRCCSRGCLDQYSKVRPVE